MNIRRELLVGVTQVAAAATVAACGHRATVDPHDPCATDTRADPAGAALDKRGAAGAIELTLVSTEPATPARGDNKWIIELRAISAGTVGEPVTGANVTATPFMPDHGHGTPIKVNVMPLAAPGQYALSPVNLWMPGYWETTVRATRGALTDAAVFRFCVST